MMWGGGTSDGRRPASTVKGLCCRGLESRLRNSARQIINGQLTGAFQDSMRGGDDKIWGTDWAYFTKWFWVVSLSEPTPSKRPLILDSRVIRTLRRYGLTEFSVPNPQRWVEYVDKCHLWAAGLSALLGSQQPGHPPVDAEKIEYLLWHG
jgi:hypothetical protein